MIKILKNTTINCSSDTKESIKMVAEFTKTSQRHIIKSLMINQGIMPSDGTLNVFTNWDSETKIRYKLFADQFNKMK